MMSLCYVLGCDERPIVCCAHKLYGRVAACPSHNPIKHAYDAPLVAPRAIVLQAPASAAPVPPTVAPDGPKDGGHKVNRPIVPVRPIAPACADPF